MYCPNRVEWTKGRICQRLADWIGLVLICFVLPAVISWVFCELLRKMGWIKEGDLKLDL